MASHHDRDRLSRELEALQQEVQAYRRATSVKEETAKVDASQAQDELRWSEEKWRSLVDHAADYIVIVDQERRVQYVNRVEHGFEMSQVLGRPVESFVLPEYRSLVRERVGHVFDTAEPTSFETTLVSPNGQTLILSNRLGPIYRDGGVHAVSMTVTDVTEEKRNAEQRRALEERVAVSQKMDSLALLAGGVADDFSALFDRIVSNARDALLEAREGSSMSEALLDLQTAAQYGAQLTKQLQSFAGGGRLALEALSVQDLLHELRPLVDAAVAERTTIKADLRPSSPILGDAGRLRQAVLALVVNAAEAIGDDVGVVAIETGEIDLAAEDLERNSFGQPLSPGRHVVIEVQDSGEGIDGDEIARIFDPFYTTKVEGRGLGLTAALGIARNHGGAIQVTSAPGKGSSVRLVLPLASDP